MRSCSGLARLGLGADFRERAPYGGMTESFLNQFRARFPRLQHFNDRPGIHVFPSEPQAVFHRLEAQGVMGKAGERVVEVAGAAKDRGLVLTDIRRLAFDLYS